jgi:DNA-binding MarR family transcriptional regulator
MRDRAFAARIDAVRTFNRFYTRHIGVLRKDYLSSPYSLTEARVLYELANRPRPAASDLARDLDLDAGYLSRLLRGFEVRGLIRRTASPADRRRRVLVLTRRGAEACAPLDARSQRQTVAMLRRLPAAGQARLIEAMRTIEVLLRAGPATRSADRMPARRSAR